MRDAVDAIVEQWQAVRPELGLSAMEIFGRLTRAGSRIDRQFLAHGMDREAFDLLATLRRGGPPYELTPSQLSRSLLASSATMTGRLDRLARLGFIERRAHPSDRRGVIVRLTEQGVRATDELVEALLEEQERILDAFTPEDRRRLVELLRALMLALDSREPDDGEAERPQGGFSR
jgi:DNA-binding MarR family transcriptional regulator